MKIIAYCLVGMILGLCVMAEMAIVGVVVQAVTAHSITRGESFAIVLLASLWFNTPSVKK